MNIVAGRIYRYKEKDYYVVNRDGRMKINSVWVPCVIYYPMLDTSQLYAREYGDFEKKFKAI